MRKELNWEEGGGGASQAFCSSGRKDTTASLPCAGSLLASVRKNRHVVHDWSRFLAEAGEMRVQWTRSILLLRVFQRVYFTKERVNSCLVYSSQSSNEYVSAFTWSNNVFRVGSSHRRPHFCSERLPMWSEENPNCLRKTPCYDSNWSFSVDRSSNRSTGRPTGFSWCSWLEWFGPGKRFSSCSTRDPSALASWALPPVLEAQIKDTFETVKALSRDDQLDQGDGSKQPTLGSAFGVSFSSWIFEWVNEPSRSTWSTLAQNAPVDRPGRPFCAIMWQRYGPVISYRSPISSSAPFLPSSLLNWNRARSSMWM